MSSARRHRLIRLGLAVSAAVSLAAVASVPMGSAQASPAPPITRGTGSSAGYFTFLADADPHTVRTSFVVPTTACPSPATSSLTIAARIAGSTKTVPAFTQIEGGVTVTCTGGVPTYRLFTTALVSGTVGRATAPGDTVRVIAETTPTASHVTAADLTLGRKTQGDGPGMYQVELITDVQGSPTTQFPTITGINLFDTRPDGTTYESLADDTVVYDEVTTGLRPVLLAGELRRAGTAFTVTPPTT